MHATISGTVDFKEPNDEQCMARMRSLVAKMGERHASRPEVFRRRDFDAKQDAPRFPAEDVYGLLNPEPEPRLSLARRPRPRKPGVESRPDLMKIAERKSG